MLLAGGQALSLGEKVEAASAEGGEASVSQLLKAWVCGSNTWKNRGKTPSLPGSEGSWLVDGSL